MSIREDVKNNNIKIHNAEKRLSKAQSFYNTEIALPQKANNEILDEFRAKVNDKLRSESTCSCHLKWLYDSADFIGEGITMRIDADHPNDIRDSDWTWDEVEDILSK